MTAPAGVTAGTTAPRCGSSLGFRAAAPEGAAGSLRLRVGRGRPVPGGAARAFARRSEFNGVLRLMQPLYLDGSGQVAYVAVNPGGAYFGEDYEYLLEAEPGASLLFSSQSATRVHRTPVRPAVQRMEMRIGAGARIEYVPEQLIAYRDASYRQETVVVVEPDSTLFLAEILTPGWDPEGTPFTYADVRLRTEVRTAAGGVVCVDSVRLTPGELGEGMAGMGQMEGRSHMGSLLLCGPHATEELADAVRALPSFETLRAGATRGERHGISWLAVRALADSTDALARFITDVNELDRSETTGQGRLDLRRY